MRKSCSFPMDWSSRRWRDLWRKVSAHGLRHPKYRANRCSGGGTCAEPPVRLSGGGVPLDPQIETLARELLNALQLDIVVLALKADLGSLSDRIEQIAL